MEHFRQEDIDELFTDLKVIGSIRQHQRISTCGPHIRIDDNSMLQPVRRAWLGEDRESNLRGIKRTMQTANALIDLSLTPPYTGLKMSFLNRIQMELENTIRGLRNLQTTYDGDITIRSKLDVHIENVTNKFNSIRQRLEQQRQPSHVNTSSPIRIPSGTDDHDSDCGGGAGELSADMVVGSSEATVYGTPTTPSITSALRDNHRSASSSCD